MFNVGHIGIPTNDFNKTKEFYKDLGYDPIFETILEDGVHVLFIDIQGVVFEFYEGEVHCPLKPTIDQIVINTQMNEETILGPSGERIQLRMNDTLGLDHIVLNTSSLDKLKNDLLKHGFIEETSGFRQGDVNLVLHESEEEKVITGSVNHIAFNESSVRKKALLIKEKKIPIVEGINFLPFFENGVIYFVTENQDGLRLEYNQMI